MTQYSGSEGMGVGGQGDPLLGATNPVAAAASQTLPQDPTGMAAELVKMLNVAKGGYGGPGMIPGATPSKPIMPQAPTQGSKVGIPQGPFGTVGERKRADKQALFSSIGGLVDKARDRIYQQKVQTIQHDFETLGNAINGYNEGKATGNQQMIDHNAKIINDMVMDPKKNKEFSKAFDVNLNPMAEKKGKGQDKPDPAKDALKAAYSKYQQDFQSGKTPLSPQAQAVMAKMPQTLQANPQYQQYLEEVKAGARPKSADILTFEKGMMDVQEKIYTNAVTNDTKMKLAENLGKAMRDRTLMQQYGAILRTQMMQMGAGDRALIMADALKYRADQALKGQTDRTNMFRERLEKAGTDDAKKLKLYMDGLDKAGKKNSKDLEDAKKRGDTTKMAELANIADGIEYQQRLANDKAERMVGIDPTNVADPKKLGLSDSEYLLYKEIFTDQTQPSGEAAPANEE